MFKKSKTNPVQTAKYFKVMLIHIVFHLIPIQNYKPKYSYKKRALLKLPAIHSGVSKPIDGKLSGRKTNIKMVHRNMYLRRIARHSCRTERRWAFPWLRRTRSNNAHELKAVFKATCVFLTVEIQLLNQITEIIIFYQRHILRI